MFRTVVSVLLAVLGSMTALAKDVYSEQEPSLFHGGFARCDHELVDRYVPPIKPHVIPLKYPRVDFVTLPSFVGVDFRYCVGSDGGTRDFSFKYLVKPENFEGDLSPYGLEIERAYLVQKYTPAKLGDEAIEVCGCEGFLTFESQEELSDADE